MEISELKQQIIDANNKAAELRRMAKATVKESEPLIKSLNEAIYNKYFKQFEGKLVRVVCRHDRVKYGYIDSVSVYIPTFLAVESEYRENRGLTVDDMEYQLNMFKCKKDGSKSKSEYPDYDCPRNINIVSITEITPDEIKK